MFTLANRKKPAEKPNLRIYSADIPLNRLRLGVDNLRFDVHFSDKFVKITEDLIFQLIIKHSGASPPLRTRHKINWFKDVSDFRESCGQIMTDAVNHAKSAHEIQIDYLAQSALVKFLTGEIQNQYDNAIFHFKNIIRKQEVSQQTEAHIRLREEVSGIVQIKDSIFRKTGEELFSFFLEPRRTVNELRAANFGENALLPEELFANPLLHAPMRPNDSFMMKNYVLLGHRLEDPLNYDAMVKTVADAIAGIDFSIAGEEKETVQPSPSGGDSPASLSIDSSMGGLLKESTNFEILFDFQATAARLKKMKKNKGDKKDIQTLKTEAAAKKKRLVFMYKIMAREKLLNGIVAGFEIEPLIDIYCPPLSPQEILQYIVVPKARKSILRKIKRFKKYTGKFIPVSMLNKGISRVSGVKKEKKLNQLLLFLFALSRYHRDRANYDRIRETGDSINLLSDEKSIKMSRENNSLYDFKLPSESSQETTPIINHVAIKADVRGSTDMIAKMQDQGLNPASAFSLNYFNPINNLLSHYGAEKIFIEGDAIILSIFENEEMPQRWYGISRACGLAINMLLVVHRYNKRNSENDLPRMNLGIGISYCQGAPTFFYDGNTRIMISPAINEADILSGCDRATRKHFAPEDIPFNLYLYETNEKENGDPSAKDSTILRYNVMGIELAPPGFEKLSKEIHLTRIQCIIPELQKEPFIVHTGKFPTVSGTYERIAIREAEIHLISTEDFAPIRGTGQKYYEVCTNRLIYDYVKRIKPQR
ncbi:MAG: hypothetical protein GXP53_07295 [Deltaproteobacteria bacterium]|nr:hypothetical protein [Deltaproteobacteria bacterium]